MSFPEFSPDKHPTPPPNKRHAKIISLAAAIAAILITLVLVLLREQITRLGIVGYPGVFVISLLGNATVIFPAPSYAIVFAVGGVLQPLGVGIAAGVGAALGEMTGYLTGIGGRAVFEDRVLYQRLSGWMSRYGMIAVFVLAVIPNPIFDVGGMVAGALKMPAWKFLFAAALGKSLRFFILALSGRFILGRG